MRPSPFPELPAFLFIDQPWAEEALCAQVDSEMFFPHMGGSGVAAKKVCGLCDVRANCLDWAMGTNQRHGIWGQLSRVERDALRDVREVVA